MNEVDSLHVWHRLIKKGDIPAIEAHIKQGADVNARNQFGWTPLMLAACEGNTAVVKKLLAEGADVSSINDVGASALCYAALNGECAVLEVLLEAKAPINVRPHGASIIEFAKLGIGCCKTQRHFEILNRAGAVG